MTEWKTWAPASVKSGDAGQVTARFSVFGNIDSDGDVTVPGAFDSMIGRTVPMSAYGHQSWSGALPIGKGVISATAGEAIFTGEFFGTAAAQDTRTVLAGLAELGEWSFGLDVVKSEPGKVDGRPVRLLQQLEVYEVSPVLRGSNPQTATLAVKSAEVLSPAEWAVLRRARVEADQRDAEVRTWLRGIGAGLKVEVRLARWIADLCDAWDSRFIHLPDAVVSPAARALAARAVSTYAKRLNVAAPRVAWFTEDGPLTVHGFANRWHGTVLLHADQDRRELWVTAGHEVGHVAGWSEEQIRDYEPIMEREYTA